MAAKKKQQRTAPVRRAAVNAAPRGRQEFTDGYLEWEGGVDEDGDHEEGTGEVTAAVLDDTDLLVNLNYAEWSYIVRMARKGERWEGTFKRLEGGHLDSVGRCRATEVRTDDPERVLEGRWFENDTSYRWKLLLRAPARPSKKAARSTPPASRGAHLDRYSRQKLLRLGALIAEVAAGREVEPATLKALLAVHDSLKVSPRV